MQQKSINWQKIDTILLDLDGTLLDLHFDLDFWLERLPQAFAKKHNLSIVSAKQTIHAMLRQEEGKLHWYCLDYWQAKLDIDIALLKEDSAMLIQIHPFVLDFLQQAKTHKKALWLVTNAHPKTLALKMRITHLNQFFNKIITSHDYGFAKEKQEFWQKMTHATQLNKQTSIFFDDSISVLNAAKKFGISQVIAVSKPSSKIINKPINGFVNIENFSHIF
jgi:putative hydrolase of the HAD superfamily